MTTLLLLGTLAFGLGDIVDVVESDEMASAVTVYQAFDEANREITATEEYYIGRAVAANILATSTPMFQWDAVNYVNEVGAVVTGFSPLPFTYGGWHFMILDDSAINALSCPGGIVLLNRGLCDLVQNEDELAAVIAHEAAHIILSHGIQSVEKAKLTSAWTTLGHEGTRHLGSSEAQELSESYGDVVDDITMNLVTRGYSRDSEQQADSLAVHILAASGYDPMALVSVLNRMEGLADTTGPGFWQTHPSPSDRVQWVTEEIQSSSLPSPSAEKVAQRAERFTAGYTNAGNSQPEARGESTPSDRSGRSADTTGRTDTDSGSRPSSGGRR